MNKKEHLEKIYDNFDAFYQMVISAAMVSTYNCPSADADAEKIIAFIGSAFKIDKKLIDIFRTYILGDMMNVSLISDYHATASAELLDEDDKENLDLYEIKGQVLEEISISEWLSYSLLNVNDVRNLKEKMKYASFHHIYNAKMRFWQIKRNTESGDILTTRQLGLLYALGIGCEKDVKKSEKMLLRCVFWGDKISARLVNQLYLSNKHPAYEDGVFEKIYELLDEDDLPTYARNKEVKSKAVEYYTLIKMVKNTTRAFQKGLGINIELVDYLSDFQISYMEKLEFIFRFSEKDWRRQLFASENKGIIGFRGE